MKAYKKWLITATFLIIIGALILLGVMTVLKWDFKELSTSKFETNNHEISENFKNISILADTADIELVLSKDTASVECYEQKNSKHTVSVVEYYDQNDSDTTLEIMVADKRKWYEYIGINSGTPKITISIPRADYGTLNIITSTGDIKIPADFKFERVNIKVSTGKVQNFASSTGEISIKTSTGSITAQNLTADSLSLSVSTGKITADNLKLCGDMKIKVSTGKAILTDISCKNLISSGSTGNFVLKNVISSEKFDIKRSTGDVTLEKCDADEIFIETDTGNVKGGLLSEKVFIVKTDTGRINVPETVTGGRCEITTDTGNVYFE